MKAHRSLLIKPISLLLWAWFALLLISSATAAAPLVVELEVDDVISPATADFINRGLRQAQKQNAELAIIKLDTPGGLDSSMRKIIRDILASSVPVATYVGPSGARAASAGTFILYASHIAAMTPASNLGAATPVQIGPGGSPEQPQETDDNNRNSGANKNPSANNKGDSAQTEGQTSSKGSPNATNNVQAAPNHASNTGSAQAEANTADNAKASGDNATSASNPALGNDNAQANTSTGNKSASAGSKNKQAGNHDNKTDAKQSPRRAAERFIKGSALERKVRHDAAAYIRSLAQLRKRNPDFAEQAVYDAASLSAQEALEANVIEFIAPTTHDLLQQLNGHEITLDSGAVVTLNTANATIETIEPDLRNRILGLIANPQVALILMMIGVYGLFYEVTSPGFGVPGIAGLIALLLGLYAFQLLPISWAGAALMLFGVVLMIAEAFIPSFGIIGVGGIIAFVIGGFFLTDSDVPGYELSIGFLIGLAIVSAGLIVLITTMAIRSHRRKIVSGAEEMVGLTGKVTSVNDSAYAHVRGENWQVLSPHHQLAVGDLVKVTAISGLVLTVEPIHKTPAQLSISQHTPDSNP